MCSTTGTTSLDPRERLFILEVATELDPCWGTLGGVLDCMNHAGVGDKTVNEGENQGGQMGSSAGPQSPPCSGAPGSPAYPALTFSPGATQPRSARQRVWKRRKEAPPLACEHAQGHSCAHPNVCVRLVPTPPLPPSWAVRPVPRRSLCTSSVPHTRSSRGIAHLRAPSAGSPGWQY